MIKGIQFIAAIAASGVALLSGANSSELIVELPIPLLQEQALPEENFYISSGIPLAEAVVEDTGKLRLLDANGDRVQAQFSTLAYWPDGSVKWLGISPLLSAKTSLPLRLYQSQVANEQTSDLSVSTPRAGEVIVRNSKIEVKVQDGQWYLRDLQSNEEIEALIELDHIARTPQKVRSGWLASRAEVKGKPSQTYTTKDSATSVTIEESGPVRAVVRVQGSFKLPDTDRFFNRYDYRLYIYADSASVRWQPSWIFDGDPAVDSIGRLEAVLRSSSQEKRQAIAGVWTEDTKLSRFEVADRLLQDTLDTVTIGEQTQPGRAAGWITLRSGSSQPLNVAVKEFWQLYPSGFKLENGQLAIGLWPGDSEFILDLARTSDGTGDGEHGADLEADATGTGRTFDLLINVGADEEDFSQIAAIFEQEPLFYPGSRYMVGTEVLGRVAYEDHQSFPRLEGFYRAATHWLMENRREFGWYGFIDYGDVRTNYRSAPPRWNTKGRYGWRQGSGDVPEGIMMQYFRTGDPVVWELGAPYARHILDVDTVHYAREKGDQPRGAMHRRGQDHWSGSVQSQYTYGQGAFLYHYLSGDLRARSVLLEEVAPWQSAPEQANSVNAANTVVRAWEATADPQWLEAAKQQMDRYLNENAYNNFRFALDYVPALMQYTRLTGDERGLDTIQRQTEKLLDAQAWAYFHPGIDIRGGRMMLLADMYYRTGDETQYIAYPARLLATALPPLPPEQERWDFATLTKHVLASGLNASLFVIEVGRGPYFMAALQDAGWNERKLRAQPAVYGTRPSSSLIGTASNVGQRTEAHANDWRHLQLPAQQHCQSTAEQIIETIRGLPAGGGLYVNEIPFMIQGSAAGAEQEVLLLCEGHSVDIDVPAEATGVYLLGPMIQNGDWNEGAEVMHYTLHLRNGERVEGVWRNLIDLNDYRGLHYAKTATPGRFWQVGARSRVHAYVQHLDFKGKEVEKITLRDSGQGYISFILSATAALPGDRQEPIAEVLFATEQEESQNRFIFNEHTATAEESRASGWMMGPAAVAGLEFKAGRVSSDGMIALQIPFEDGEYLVELKVSATNRLGTILQIGVSGNGIGVVALSGDEGDRLQIPARVKDGTLRVWVNSVPALHSHPSQRPTWELESVKVYPLPAGEWQFYPELNMDVISGELLAEYGQFSQSVGRTPQYAFRGLEQLRAKGNVYQVEHSSFPQDIILTFEEPVEITGVLFSPISNFGPKKLALQVRHSETGDWNTIGEWELEAESVGLLEAVERQTITAARFLMNGGHGRGLKVVRADIFGFRGQESSNVTNN